MSNYCIGVFDSGVGGKLIANKIKALLPQTKVIFISDPKHFPYGNKSKSYIYHRAVVLTQKLINKNCQLIVIACNSVTTNSIKKLRHKFPRQKFIGIEPAIKPLEKLSSTKKIAIMGTKATMTSNRLKYLLKKYGQHVKCQLISCPKLASQIENSVRNNKPFKLSPYLKKTLRTAIDSGVDVVGLACTHYPYIMAQLKKLYPQVIFYDPANTVCQQVKNIKRENTRSF